MRWKWRRNRIDLMERESAGSGCGRLYHVRICFSRTFPLVVLSTKIEFLNLEKVERGVKKREREIGFAVAGPIGSLIRQTLD